MVKLLVLMWLVVGIYYGLLPMVDWNAAIVVLLFVMTFVLFYYAKLRR